MEENKQTYFYLNIELPESSDKKEINDCVDLVFNGMEVEDEWYEFQSTDEKEITFLMKSTSRKRPGQLRRICERNIPLSKIISFRSKGMNKESFYNNVDKFQQSLDWQNNRTPTEYQIYLGNDLKVFENHQNFYPWQKEIYDMIFDSNGELIKPDDRTIINILDEEGKKGKSSFIKYLCFKSDRITKIGYGLSSQLRSAIINAKAKTVYIIDLPRTKGTNDKIEDLLSAIEDTKNGFLISPMYGKENKLMMDPPFILVFSNNPLPYGLLSKDRWKCYQISSDLHLKPINTVTNKSNLFSKRSISNSGKS